MFHTRNSAAALDHASPRRAFLRGLVTLPLIGGAVTLIGNPVRADGVPAPALLERYVAWLANEHAAAAFELDGGPLWSYAGWSWDRLRYRAPLGWFPDAPDVEAHVLATKPSTRAALVLSAVGCDWRAAA